MFLQHGQNPCYIKCESVSCKVAAKPFSVFKQKSWANIPISFILLHRTGNLTYHYSSFIIAGDRPEHFRAHHVGYRTLSSPTESDALEMLPRTEARQG